jgi:hypothetical protein
MSAYYDRNDTYYTAMRDSADPYSYPSSYRSPYEPRAPPLPRRSAGPHHQQQQQQQYTYRAHSRRPTWPPSPSVEDETTDREGEPPVNTRGTVDQEKVLEDIEHPDDRRYVLVSDSSSRDASPDRHISIRHRRRKSFAERSNMAHINTDVEEPLVFPERVSTPYAYTKPQRESTALPRAEFLSPEPMTPASAGTTPRYVPSRDTRGDVFDDSDVEQEDTAHLRTAERKPARYSFVKSDLQREDLRTNLRDSQPRRRDSGQRAPPPFRKHESSSSPRDRDRDSPYAESPHSSSSSLNSGPRKPRPAPVETAYYTASRPSSRPSSPLPRVPSPKLPPRLRESPESSRPSSRGNPRPASPLAFSSNVRPPSPHRKPVTDVDWHATYPPATSYDRSRPPSRVGRHETMSVPHPRIDVQSPSPARSSTTGGALPYPVDDRPLGVFMPSEAHYQFDHSIIASPRQAFPDSPRASNPPLPASPRRRDEPYRPKDSAATPEEPSRTRKTRSNSLRSQASLEGRREKQTPSIVKVDWQKPLPSCPRSMPSTKYDDWWSLKGYPNFNICPSCYEGVFAKTPFDVHFSQNHRGERPTERACDFSSPWVRLAWLLTIKQRRPSLELLYEMADIADSERPCPDNREVGNDRVAWYGIPDQRDGVHVANFAICACDKKMIEALLPSLRGYFTRLPSTYSSSIPEKYMCSLRTSSRRFPKYLDLLVELDTEAQDLEKRPNINRFVQLARENAFRGECGRDKAYFRKPWHFIPALPELTVCEECYDELIWPALQSKSSPTTIPRLFNKAIQLVSIEDPEVGSSCCLYSPRMRKVFDIAVKEADFTYLKRKALERKKIETRFARERNGIMKWMSGLERGSTYWERAKDELKALDRDWDGWE